MAELTVVTRITCPYCWESIELIVDLSVESQRYVEDCHVCCRPIVVEYRTENSDLIDISAQMENG
jgi:transposase-like protein